MSVLLKAGAMAGAAAGEASFGSEDVFESNATGEQVIRYDPSNADKIAVAYEDDNYDWKIIIGSISGTEVTWGTALELYNQISSCRFMDMDWDSNTGKIVVAYRYYAGGQYYCEAKLISVSGTTATVDHTASFNGSNRGQDISIAFDPNNSGKFVIVYGDKGDSDQGQAVVGTVSGPTISFGSEYTFSSAAIGTSETINVKFDPNNSGKFVVVWTDDTSYQGKARVGTVSGTAISWGTTKTWYTSNPTRKGLAFDPNTSGKFVVIGMDGGTGVCYSYVGTISGTTITFGSSTSISSCQYPDVVYNQGTANEFLLVYRDTANSNYGTLKIGTVYGTSIAYDDGVVFNEGDSMYTRVDFDPNTAGKFTVAYEDVGNSQYGTAIVGQLS